LCRHRDDDELMPNDSLTTTASALLESAGFIGASLQSETPPEAHFGNSQAVFRVGWLLLRFTRDRGQDFVDLAGCLKPARFYQFDDVEIAMGWATIDHVISKVEPEPLAVVLARLRKGFDDLEKAFAADQESATRKRIERASRLRGEAMIERFRHE
jgi:hypothetical protein